MKKDSSTAGSFDAIAVLALHSQKHKHNKYPSRLSKQGMLPKNLGLFMWRKVFTPAEILSTNSNDCEFS
jgi:hypothetical protein